jgi:hypothetical protein
LAQLVAKRRERGNQALLGAGIVDTDCQQ